MYCKRNVYQKRSTSICTVSDTPLWHQLPHGCLLIICTHRWPPNSSVGIGSWPDTIFLKHLILYQTITDDNYQLYLVFIDCEHNLLW